MPLQEQIKKDLTKAIREKDEERKDAFRVILGEMARSDKKEFTDDEVIKTLKKLQKSEKEVLEKQDKQDSVFLEVVENYLPAEASEEEIRSWIENNIDFSRYKNKMQAMGEIMKHFGSRADGNRVKKVLQSF